MLFRSTRDYHAYQTVRNLRDKSLLSVLSLWWIRDEMERIRLLVPAQAEALERVCEYLSMPLDTQHGCFDIADRFNTVIRLGVGAIEHTCECPRGILAEQGNGGGRLRVIAAEYIQQSRLLCDRPQVASFRKRKLELLCCTDGVRESRESALLLDVTQQQ